MQMILALYKWYWLIDWNNLLVCTDQYKDVYSVFHYLVQILFNSLVLVMWYFQELMQLKQNKKNIWNLNIV